MDITKYIPLFITFIFTLIGSYITIKINIIELKKDISFLRSKIEADDNYQLANQSQAKIDMKEVKDDLKIICKLIKIYMYIRYDYKILPINFKETHQLPPIRRKLRLN